MKLLISISLLIAALLLGTLLIPIGFLYALIKSIFKGKGERYLYKVAVSIDQLGNTTCADFFGLTLISNKSLYLFGNEDETISSVLGRNKQAGTLTFAGRLLCSILDLIEKNHVEKSIGA